MQAEVGAVFYLVLSMNNLHIENSYKIWGYHSAKIFIVGSCIRSYGTPNAQSILNRSYCSMYVEWILHNIGYYITKPFCFVQEIRKLNLRFKDVDLEEW